MTIHKDNLPHPSAVDPRKGPLRATTPRGGNLIFNNTPDPVLVLELWRLSWIDVRREVADAIWRHYLAHNAATFAFTDPRTAEVRTVRWASAPSMSWNNPTTASVVGELETALAHE